MQVRIEVRMPHTAAAREIVRQAATLGIRGLTACNLSRLYFLSHHPGTESLQRLCALLLVDPVTEQAHWQIFDGAPPPAESPHAVIEVAPRPGVTDVEARELVRGMAELGLPTCEVATAMRYELVGDLSQADLHRLARQLLCNETVEHYCLGPIIPQFGVAAQAGDQVETVPIRTLTDPELLALSRDRLLSLDVDEMRAIQAFYVAQDRDPTDVELETLAQTWSEHCVHKTFRACIDFTWLDEAGQVKAQETIDGLLRTYIRAATEAIAPPWLHSAFVDNAGIIAFDDTHDLAFKVETHNHPSALEPFGGANTGVGGVVRDILGVSARPIATTDVLCFGPQDLPHEELPEGVLHPRRIADGVVAGIGDYGNKLGLPTASGAVLYDPGYLGNPLVFCGCAGLLPRGSHPTAPQPGDLVVVLGGRTGRDGLHGATFSSAELTHETGEIAGSAVQIGDPITEKGLIEVVERARDQQLYHAITDCGAGGLSSAVGEMGETLGVEVELTRVPLKYPGLVPWEIWLSEAQERMVMAVPPDRLKALQALAEQWDVELSVLGRFRDDGQLRVYHDGRVVADLPMAFLHEGLPRRHMRAVYQDPAPAEEALPDRPAGELLLALLAHPTVASKEAIIRRYDHEVRGGTLVRPCTGPELDGPTDAAVLKPLGTWHHSRAFALSAGINPLLGRRDPYAMAVSAVDEAVRNAVAVGADPDYIAILDNFCWGNPTLPDRLGGLVRACQGCYDAALAYRAPFISGKDSLYNEFNGQPIPGTLLISAIALVPDMHHTVTSDLKAPGNRLYLVGETRPELGGSLLYALLGQEGGTPPGLLADPLPRYRALHRAIRQGLVQACHDLSEGGLAVALAEMAIAGRLGAAITLPTDDLADSGWLFSESNGRLLVEVAPEDVDAFEAHFQGLPLIPLGDVTSAGRLRVQRGNRTLIDLELDTLVSTWKGSLS
ncbi:phosphoribosylformylglycinamidine synthase subunit PurL [Litorilinea aerophila]|uniref:Phosphoribosylformylglycinamidine synthase subunit PurL n=1 Tax=Litorilinea aerophila TaxID=1204385 RepID=A0A540VGA4_9CHLR|nr:phosphoribosylformylglycinamidine synthase subunit PurL [Litorilinea aerophila]MCC9076482.1 phosphoribosylformylglycinamidine synthase subunit PurL [Litorilinea aerophila]